MKTSSDSPLVLSPVDRNYPLDLLVSCTTPVVVLTLLLGKVLNQQLQEFSLASEEVFRGDRLPLLDFPEPPQVDA